MEPMLPTRLGYTFVGWNTQKYGSDAMWDFENSTMPSNDIILYAQWEKNSSEGSNESNESSQGGERNIFEEKSVTDDSVKKLSQTGGLTVIYGLIVMIAGYLFIGYYLKKE
nr:InlB B-repeat-containing protein [endosymbiont 'TC1' of Trimyema compressum]